LCKSSGTKPAAVPYPFPKRALDKFAAAVLLLLFTPAVFVVLAALLVDMAVARADRGAVLYREPRVSAGRTFELLKFRTLREEVLAAAAGHAGPLEHDSSNLTWVGRRLLKPWYLDEVPQLVNVLRGDISLVGPRPWPPALVERQLANGFDYRNRIRAGLTGPAQVTKGISGARYAEQDLRYVEACETLAGWSLVRYDLGILRQTVAVIVRGEGLNY
jgi:lipopolysaccharide/colanic/teichoic acid biosynthesis glycosyltransferase